MTNNIKAQVIVFANAALLLFFSFFSAGLTNDQQAATIGSVNATLSLWLLLTYKNSPKRIPDK